MKAALVGHGIQNSLTPVMHMAEAGHQGFEYQYDIVDPSTSAHHTQPLEELIANARRDGLAGLNITHPYKLEAAKIADVLVGSARELETVNTLVFDGDKVVGHNTDYVGYRSSLQRYLPAADMRNIVLFGAGGAGRSVALALVDQGARCLTVLDSNSDNASRLAAMLRLQRPNADIRIASKYTDVDFKLATGVVNATPVGMAAHPGSVLDVTDIRREAWVSDIVYLPLETVLLKRARMRGNRVMDGVGMAVYQAVTAFKLLTGKDANPERMLASLKSSLFKQLGEVEAQTA